MLTVGIQNLLDVAAQVGSNADPATFEFPKQGLGDRGAKEDVDRKFGDASGKGFGRLRVENELAAPRLFPALSRDQQQACGGVEDRRDTLLANWNGDSHGNRHGGMVCAGGTARPVRRWVSARSPFHRGTCFSFKVNGAKGSDDGRSVSGVRRHLGGTTLPSRKRRSVRFLPRTSVQIASVAVTSHGDFRRCATVRTVGFFSGSIPRGRPYPDPNLLGPRPRSVRLPLRVPG